MTGNPIHRALFALPPIQLSAETALAVPELPPQRLVTGDSEVDAVIWLREVIGTGQPALIAKAKKAAKKIKAPFKDLEKRYSAFLARTSNGHFSATFAALGFSDLEGWEKTSIEMAARRYEANARFGDALFENTAAETFSEEVLAGAKPGRNQFDLDKGDVDARFDAHANQRPATLSDCLVELTFWNDLYWLRNSMDREACEGSTEAYARKEYTFRCLGRIPPRSTSESYQVLQYMIDDNAMDWEESFDILRNLMTRAPEVPKLDATKLRSLREQLHPSLLPLYPELLTQVTPPTRRDVIDVLEQLDAISYSTGISNTAHFAMDVIGSLVAMIDLEQLEPGDPRPALDNGGDHE